MYPDQGSLLVVDDNENNRDMLGRRLARRGYTVTMASGGQQALALIATQAFDLVLLDIMMPDIDGLSVLATLRQTYTAIELPIIMVTVKDQSTDIVEALRLGANDYVTKPIDFPVALARIRTQLGHKRAEEALQQARQAALDLARQRADFLAHMSHEMRTPLNGMLGMSAMLLTMGLTAEQHEVATIVHTSAQALLPLLNNVLDSAKLEAGKLTLESAPFDVRATVEGVLEVMAERAVSKQLDLVAAIARDVPPMVCGDAGRLRQILLNLVSNAIKWTERGEVVVEVARINETASHVQIRFAVRDTGSGIPAAAQGCLFQPFSQVGGAATARADGGTGLGLSICKQLAVVMGGDIDVASTPGAGSTFTLTLPYVRHAAPTPVALRPHLAFRGVRVLVVEPHATSRDVVQHYVTAWGMRGHGAASAAEALALVQEQAATPYELVLLALSGPDTDGIALARALASTPTRVVLMLPLGQHRNALLQATGAVAALTKPIKHAQLYTCLDEVLTRRVDGPTAMETAPLPAPVSTPSHAPRTVTTPQETRILVVDDNLVTQQVLLQQLQKLGYKAEAVTSSHAMREALAQTSYDLVLIDGHLCGHAEYAAAVALCHQTATAHYTPLIAITTTTSAAERDTCLAAGMDDTISKPVQANDIQAILCRWLPPVSASAA